MAEALAPQPTPPAERAGTPYRRRFWLVYALLALIVGGTVGTFIFLLDRVPADSERERETASRWSTWQPQGEGIDRAPEIAEFVGRRYRLENGDQLVAVRAGLPTVQNVPIAAIAIRSGGEGVASQGDITVLESSSSVVYILCGLGKQCAIEEGEPTVERGQLVRREALELALYSFTYIDGLESVVVFLPPPKGEAPSSAVLFRREDLQTQLARPLRLTLPEAKPPAAGEIDAREARMIDRLTMNRMFGFQFQQLQDGRPILVLAQPRASDG